MKTYSIYGAAMALGGAVLLIVLYLLGMHSDPAKLTTAQILGTVGGLVIGIVCISLGIKARRAEFPRTEEFTYGQAFVSGFMITLFGALFGLITNYGYAAFINPGMADVVVQAQAAKMEEKGMTAAQVEAVEKVTRSMMSPPIQSAIGCLMGLLVGTVISLVVAAFLKRPAALLRDPNVPPPPL